MRLQSFVAALTVAACLGGCSGSGGETSDGGKTPDSGADAVAAGPCAPFAGKRFVSLATLECGLGAPDGGLIVCYWHVTFSVDGTFSWQHSDYIQAGTYACDGNTVTSTTTGGATLGGSWDPKTAQLSWQNAAYTLE